jgi:flagellar basal-body rod protein FlgB
VRPSSHADLTPPASCRCRPAERDATKRAERDATKRAERDATMSADPVALAERRLHWLDRRQQVLARNIANADTPGFRPSDLAARNDTRTLERAPNGNAVALDEQAMKVADTETAHALAIGLHRRYLGLFRAALGRGT